MDSILKEIVQERKNQDAKWGEQNYPILDPMLINSHPERMCLEYEIPSEHRAKFLCENSFDSGTPNWMCILVEEISESASCGSDTVALRKELIQVASVVVAMIESLDRNNK